MILLVIFNSLFILGIVLGIIFYHYNKDVLCSVFAAIAVSFGIGSIVMDAIVLDTNLHENSYYASRVAQKEVYEYRLENEDFSINDYEELYKHIIEFNNEIITTREFRDSAWIGCFYNHKVGDIELIELPKRE